MHPSAGLIEIGELIRRKVFQRLRIRPHAELQETGEDDGRLERDIFGFLILKLYLYGNRPSLAQYDALWKLCKAYSDMAIGRIRGRFAFPLTCGAGKTLSVIAFCQALRLLQLRGTRPDMDRVSVLVSASKVEALCQLKRDLLKAGVPEDWIGLYHSYQYHPDKIGEDGYASEPDTGDYHIDAGSAAIDKGIDAGVKTDIDFHPRPYLTPDLGSDEYWPPGTLKFIYLPLVLR